MHLLIITSLLSGFTYPLICAIYFKTLIRRRNEIDGLFQGTIMNKHIRVYGGLSPKDVFSLFHNWKDYVLPIALNMIVVSFVSLALMSQGSDYINNYIKSNAPLLSIFTRLPLPASAGFVGAYIFSHYEMIGRFSTMDLTSTILYRLWLRLLIGGTLGYLVSFTIQPPLQLLTAFGIGVIPFDKLRDLIERMALKPLNIGPKGAVSDQPTLHKLQGLTEDVINRLQDEGITTTQHLAFANPVLLLLKTNFQWTVILDMINQAILYIFIGDKIEDQRTIGIRSATDITKIKCLLTDENGNKLKTGEKLGELMATKLGQDSIGVYNLIETINDNPQVRFICDLWEETCKRGRSEN